MTSEEIFSLLYDNISGSSLSWKARNKMSDDDIKHLIYGEIGFKTLEKIYNKKSVQPFLKNISNFCDLGSGTGRIVVGSSLLLPNLKSYSGIELLDELHQKATEIKEILSNYRADLSEKICFIKDSFFNVDLSKFDIIFMHYPMKNAESLYLELEEKMKKELKTGAVVISVIRKMKNIDIFPLVKKMSIEADYGTTTIYYHVKYEKNS